MDNILKTELWKYLPISTIARIAQCNHVTQKCQLEHNFWSYMLQRDFDEFQGGQASYLSYYKILKYFTAFIPKITETTLKLIEKFVPEDEWNNIKSAYREYIYPHNVLNARLLLELIGATAPGEPESDQDEDYYEEWEAAGNEKRNKYVCSMINKIEQYLLGKYSVTRVRRRRGLRNPDLKDLEPILQPIYIKSNIYTASTKQIVNVDQDYLFTLVDYGLKATWSSHLCPNDYECKERMIILSEVDV